MPPARAVLILTHRRLILRLDEPNERLDLRQPLRLLLAVNVHATDERLTVRMTGCPNGCARPYNADIGLVGRSAEKNADGSNNPGTYTIFLGGSTLRIAHS